MLLLFLAFSPANLSLSVIETLTHCCVGGDCPAVREILPFAIVVFF